MDWSRICYRFTYEEELDDDKSEFLAHEELATALPTPAGCNNDEPPAQGLDDKNSLRFMAAGTHKGKSKGGGKNFGKGKNNKGKGKHVLWTNMRLMSQAVRFCPGSTCR